jgi:putative holliday junction resolvase
MVWLAIDHGLKRLGVAVGDDQVRIATPVGQLLADDPDLISKIAEFVERYGAGGIVVGWPVNDDGSEGPQAKLARDFAARLAREVRPAGPAALDVRLWDEHLSSFEADQRLAGQHTRAGKKRRQDSVAAAAFLQEFLNCEGPRKAVKATQT